MIMIGIFVRCTSWHW